MASLLIESWTWYGFGCLIFIARCASRWLQLGSVKKYQADDFVMMATFGFYTTLIAVMNVVSHYSSNLMLPEEIPLLTPDSIKSRIYGSKLVLVVEQSMILTTWGCKVCLLICYSKLTIGLGQRLAVKVIAGYVAFGFVLMEILYFGVWCRPFDHYWQVPVENTQCSAATNHLIVNACLNISSDVFMLFIPIPLLIHSQLPRGKKVILCGLFGLGTFVILCAILNKYYSFVHPFAPTWSFWYIREASCAIFVANMPMCWFLIRRIFNVRSFNNSSLRTGTNALHTSGARGGGKPHVLSSTTGSKARDGKPDASWWDREGPGRSPSASEEHIVMQPIKPLPLEIWESKQFDVAIDGASVENGLQRDTMFGGRAQTKTVVTTVITATRKPDSVKSFSTEDSREKS